MLHPTRIIEERLRRFVVLVGTAATAGWILWIVPRWDLLAQRCELHGLPPWFLTALCVLDVVLVVLGCVGALAVLRLYRNNTVDGGVVDASATRPAPAVTRRRERLERWSWLPVEAFMVVTPIIVVSSTPLRASLASGVMSTTDTRLSFGLTIALLCCALFAAARLPSSWAFGYVALTHVLRLASYLVVEPATAPAALVVVAPSAVYGTAAVFLVGFLRKAAASLDRRMTRTTVRHQAVSRHVAEEGAAVLSRDLLENTLLPVLRVTATPGEDAREPARFALDTLDAAALDIGGPTSVPAPVVAEQLGTEVQRSYSGAVVRFSVDESAEVPDVARSHVRAAVRELLRGVAPDCRPEVFVVVGEAVVGVTVRITGPSHPGPGPRGVVAPDALERAETRMRAVPGGALRRVAGDGGFVAGPSEVVLTWRSGFGHGPTREEVTADVEGELSGQFRIQHIYPSRRDRLLFVVPIAVLLALVATMVVLTTSAYTDPWLEALAVAIAAVVVGVGVHSVLRKAGAVSPGPVASTVLGVGAAVVVGIGALNLRDPEGFVLEVEWWHGTFAVLVVLWLAAVSGPVSALVTALMCALVLVVWGLWSGHGGTLLDGGMPLILGGVVLMSLMVAWTRTQLVHSALTRRRRRIGYIDVAFHRAQRRSTEGVLRYLDDMLRPFLTEQASGIPATASTRERAAQLAARLEDDQRAPCFRGSDVTRAAADARARGVHVELVEHGVRPGLRTDGEDFLLSRVSHLAGQALDAAVDGAVRIEVGPPGDARAALVTIEPADEEPRSIEVLADACVVYDGIRVPATREDFR